MNGKLIVIEGLDGCGKATQSALLYEELLRRGIKAEKISFPDYDSLSSGPVRMYLGGEFGTDPDDVDCYATSVLFAVDRFCSYRSSWKQAYEEGTVFVCDRYTTSNEVFQTSKLPREGWKEYLRWLEDTYADSVRRFRLEVCPQNPAAKRLYERYGYREMGYLPMVKD